MIYNTVQYFLELYSPEYTRRNPRRWDDILICLPFIDCSFTILRSIVYICKTLYCAATVIRVARNAVLKWMFQKETNSSSFWLHIRYCVMNLVLTCTIYTIPYFRGRQRDQNNEYDPNFVGPIEVTDDQYFILVQLRHLAIVGAIRIISNLIDDYYIFCNFF